jgi:hypothetical protein
MALWFFVVANTEIFRERLRIHYIPKATKYKLPLINAIEAQVLFMPVLHFSSDHALFRERTFEKTLNETAYVAHKEVTNTHTVMSRLTRNIC